MNNDDKLQPQLSGSTEPATPKPDPINDARRALYRKLTSGSLRYDSAIGHEIWGK